MTDAEDRSVGCILGAFIGDSLGSYLESKKGVQSLEVVEKGMEMPGGGCWNLAPGQLTDDSELAMCMMHGLVEGKGTLDTSLICKYYAQWFKFEPFAIGKTTKTALSAIDVKKPTAMKAKKEAKKSNSCTI